MSWFLKRVGLLPRAGLSDPPLAGSTASVPGELPGITSASPSLSATDDANPAESNCQQMALHRNVDLIGTVAHGGVEFTQKISQNHSIPTESSLNEECPTAHKKMANRNAALDLCEKFLVNSLKESSDLLLTFTPMSIT